MGYVHYTQAGSFLVIQSWHHVGVSLLGIS